MLSKCANPGCPVPFHYLRQGRLFKIPIMEEANSAALVVKSHYRLETYWLCDDCSVTQTLAYVKGQGVIAVPLRAKRAAG